MLTRLVVSATFSARPISEPLGYWLERLAMDLPIAFDELGPLAARALDPAGVAGGNSDGVNLWLIRVEDWYRDMAGEPAARVARAEAQAEAFVDAIRQAAGHGQANQVVVLCPPSPRALPCGPIETRIAEALAGLPRVEVSTSAQVASLYPAADADDAEGDALAQIPYTTAGFAALGTFAARRLHALRNHRFKVIVVDADQTLWNGVCGEDGPTGVRVDGRHLALQRVLKAQRAAGRLLCLSSANDRSDVEKVFAARPDMPLAWTDFTTTRVDWTPKSVHLASIAAELGVGQDSLVFVDDDDVVQAEVRARCPAVLAVRWPATDDAADLLLRHLWPLDPPPATAEAQRRAETYRDATRRRQAMAAAPSFAAFMAGLELQVDLAPLAPEQRTRADELAVRVNQFRTRAGDASAPDALGDAAAAECLTVSVRDRFGDYGLVGLMTLAAAPDTLVVDRIVLSCRALGRGVEHRMIAAAGERALRRACARVLIRVEDTGRNHLALAFIERLGARVVGAVRSREGLTLPADAAARVAYDPVSIAAEANAGVATPDSGAADAVDAVDAASSVAADSTHADTLAAPPDPPPYEAIAFASSRVDRIVAAMRSENRDRPALDVAFVAPRTPLEQEVADVWVDLLDLDRVGVHDGFFELGGHSLLAMQLLARLRRRYDIDLGLRTIFVDRFTVATLVEQLLQAGLDAADPAALQALSAEIDALSDDEVAALLRAERDGHSAPR